MLNDGHIKTRIYTGSFYNASMHSSLMNVKFGSVKTTEIIDSSYHIF